MHYRSKFVCCNSSTDFIISAEHNSATTELKGLPHPLHLWLLLIALELPPCCPWLPQQHACHSLP